MDNLQALYLELEASNAPLHFAWLCTIEDRLSLQKLRAHVHQRLVRVPNSQARAVSSGTLGGWTWEPDARFVITQHVHRIRRQRLSERSLLETCEQLFSTPLDRQRPLWDLHLIETRRPPVYVFLKVHRALLPPEDDSAFLNALLDPQPQLPPSRIFALGGAPPESRETTHIGRGAPVRAWFSFIPAAASSPRQTLAQFRLYADAVVNVLRVFVGEEATVGPLKGPLSGKHQLRHVQLPVRLFREIRNRVGGEIREIVLACISAAVEEVLSLPHANGFPEPVLALVPVALGSEQDAQRTGTRALSLIARLPGGLRDPIERLRRVSTELDQLRASDHPHHFRRGVAIFQALPGNIALRAVRAFAHEAPFHLFTLQVPGLRERRYLAGKPVTSVIPFAPIALGVRAAFVFMTYADTVSVGITTDAEHFGFADQLAQAFRSAFTALARAAGISAASIETGPAAHSIQQKGSPEPDPSRFEYREQRQT
jgi:diacylglycerol O-acyltransferase